MFAAEGGPSRPTRPGATRWRWRPRGRESRRARASALTLRQARSTTQWRGNWTMRHLTLQLRHAKTVEHYKAAPGAIADSKPPFGRSACGRLHAVSRSGRGLTPTGHRRIGWREFGFAGRATRLPSSEERASLVTAVAPELARLKSRWHRRGPTNRVLHTVDERAPLPAPPHNQLH